MSEPQRTLSTTVANIYLRDIINYVEPVYSPNIHCKQSLRISRASSKHLCVLLFLQRSAMLYSVNNQEQAEKPYPLTGKGNQLHS